MVLCNLKIYGGSCNLIELQVIPLTVKVNVIKLMDFFCCIGSVAERSKALVLGTSLFGGVGSNPTAATGFE